ncbi:MAG: putative Histidine kinase [Nitrospira sp.]|jgi:signal transduction histidine kinase|nr:putative Histidine kinase [Nitrospira sp.]
MKSRNHVVLAVAACLFLLIVAMEWMFPLNVVGAFGFVLPILLVATLRSRRLMLITLALCILVTFVGLLQPGKKRERFTAVVFNRTMVVCVLAGVAYIGVTWEERKAREEAAQAALATQSEHLLRANTQLVEIKDTLARSERLAALGQLVASVAHEVGTPLHSIAWHVEALAEEPGVTAEMRKRIGIIDEQLNRVVRIIQDLLSSTRQRKPEPTWYPAEGLVEPVVALLEPAYHAKGVTLRAMVTQSVLVWADPEKIHQVLVNLLTNALAATNTGGHATVEVSTRAASTEERERASSTGRVDLDTMVILAVTDSGCGMPREDLERAFQPFFTTKAIGKGTGLGLFLSREAVVAHGGQLILESAVGVGTTVTVVLPGLRSDPASV